MVDRDMVVILAAVYEEVAPLLAKLQFRRASGLSVYEGLLFGREVTVCLTGPGISKPGRLERFLQQRNIHLLLNVGFCGALRHGLLPGDIVVVEKFSALRQPLLYQPTVCLSPRAAKLPAIQLVSVAGVVRQPNEKEDLRHLTGADVVDMEGYHLQCLAQKLGFTDRFCCFKIVGDAFEDSAFLSRERYFRSFFREHSLWKKMLIILQTGILASVSLYRRKKMLQQKVVELLESVLKS